MRRLPFLMVLFFSSPILACSAGGAGRVAGPAGDRTDRPAAADTLTVEVGSWVTAPTFGVRVELRGVPQDSRCALGVLCVWAGNAETHLRLDTGRGDRDFVLNTLLDPVKVTIDGLTIRLLRVDPYPVHQVPIDPARYVVTLEVAG